MAPTQAAIDHRQAAHAVVVWARTVRTLRHHGEVERLSHDVLSRARREIAEQVADHGLVLELVGGEVRHAGESVLRVGRTDVPFGLLGESGVGVVELAAGATEEEIEQLLRTCAAAPGILDPSYDLARELRRIDLPSLELRAPDRAQGAAPQPTDTAAEIDWWLLPEPRPTQAIGQQIERDLAANQPSRLLDLLLADLPDDDVDGGGPPIGTLLLRLLEIMLQRNDPTSATDLLQRAEHTPGVAPQVVVQLRRRGVRALHSDWLTRQLQDRTALAGVLALAMQLGDDAIRWVAQAAQVADVELPAWVTAMLGPLE